MKSWQEDLLLITEGVSSEQEVFDRIESAAKALGFEHCAYGFRVPLQVSNPKIILLNNYPDPWRERYAEQGYLAVDPTVLHGKTSLQPIVWSDTLFAEQPQMWQEAKSFGLKHGWAQSSIDMFGIGGMLTLARGEEPITPEELKAQEHKMRWLVNIAHLSLARAITDRHSPLNDNRLTSREIEILKWTADGKSAEEISCILDVSKHTVDFHVKNAVSKLQVNNKTAAVVRAVMLGLLN